MEKMNKELVLKIAEQIENEPASYDQETYVSFPNQCGTTHCIAGWAVKIEAGDAYNYLTNPSRNRESVDDLMKKYRALWWSDIAQNLLGINDDQAESLFAGGNGPLDGLKAWEALRLWAEGSPLSEVWG